MLHPLMQDQLSWLAKLFLAVGKIAFIGFLLEVDDRVILQILEYSELFEANLALEFLFAFMDR